MPAIRARSTASLREKTKLTSLRSGLVGSTASRTPYSLARATIGTISSQNLLADSSHGTVPKLPDTV